MRSFIRAILLSALCAAPVTARALGLSFSADLGRPVEALSFSPDGALLFAAPWDKTIRAISVPEHRQLRLLNTDWQAWSLAVSPDGRTLAAAGTSKEVFFFGLPDLQPDGSAAAHSDHIAALSFSRDGKTLLSGGWDGFVKAGPWPAAQGRTAAFDLGGRVTGAALFGGGLMAALEDGTVKIYETLDPGGARTRTLRPGAAACLAASTDGQLAAVCAEGAVAVVSAVSRKVDRELSLSGPASAAAFSADGRLLAAADGDGKVHIWDTAAWKETGSFSAAGRQDALAFSPDGRRLACAGEQGVVTVWDLSSFGLVRGLDMARKYKFQLLAVLGALAGLAGLVAGFRAVRARLRQRAEEKRLRLQAQAQIDAEARKKAEKEAAAAKAAEKERARYNLQLAGPRREPAVPEGFELVKRLGGGALYEVFLVENRKEGRREALKRLPPDKFSGEAAARRLIEAAKAAAKLAHPNIEAVYGIAEKDGEFYLRCEYIEGRSAVQLLAAGSVLPGPISMRLVKDVCEALRFAHARQVPHGDIKPGNILVPPDGVAKVTDFLVAREMKDLLFSGAAGPDPSDSALYAAPELAAGASPSAAADLYALGVSLYEMAAGVKPFHGAGPEALAAKKLVMEYAPASEANPKLPPHIDEVLKRCLAGDPAGRFQSAEELWEVIRRL